MATTADEIDAAKEDSPPTALREPNWLAQLEERSLPHFNQLVIWTLLATGAILACWPFNMHEGQRRGFVSLLSWLPDDVVRSGWTWAAFRAVLGAGIVLWACQRLLPWSCWLVVMGFTGLWSLHVETTYNTAHIFHMANMRSLSKLPACWQSFRDCAHGSAWRSRRSTSACWRRSTTAFNSTRS